MSETKKANKEEKTSETIQVLESRVFNMAMQLAETYASSKKKVFRILQHAFHKLKEESARHHLKSEFKAQVNILMRMVKAYYKGEYRRLPAAALLKILGGLIYFVWILDLIPDFIPVLGLADDIAVIVWVYNGIKSELEEFELWESATALNIDE